MPTKEDYDYYSRKMGKGGKENLLTLDEQQVFGI